METAITEAFAKSVQEAVNRCMETVREESRKFAAALTAVRHLPTASPVTGGGLEHRLTALELAYERQVQKSIAGLSDDIGDLDGRLAALEKDKAPEEDTNPWSFGFQHAWPGPSKKNEVVIDDKSTVLDFGSDFVVNVRHVEEEDVDDMPGLVTVERTPVAPVVPVAPTPVAPTPVVPTPVVPVVPTPVAPVAPVEEEEEEEGDPLELEEFDHEGETYYRDQDLNVYKPNEDGEVDAEAPIGRWLANRKTIKLWS